MLPEQLRAARAMLNLSREKLAEAAGLHPRTIQQIEDETVRPQRVTKQALLDCLAAKGIEMIERGVRWRDDVVRIFEGADAYARMLDDVFYCTAGNPSEVLFFCADESNVIAGEVESEERIRANGTRFRCLVEEGTQIVRWPRNEYRVLPSAYYNHDLQVIYSDSVAQVIDKGKKIVMIRDPSFAQTERNKFNLIWMLMKPLPKEE